MEQPQPQPEIVRKPDCRVGRELVLGLPVAAVRQVNMAERDGGARVPTVEATVADGVVLKRKRGRPAKGLPKTSPPPLRQKNDEEDVCFICFDGGSLVLCDRRGCPKAYHPACIKRDEEFFRSTAKWNCGWHICSICQKASHYLCYTCTYSLCKGCTRDADFVCVRENKGLCGMCMRTIMLIENSTQGNKEKCEVDFDDKSSWEYLFKVYWVYLKGKLSLTFDELIRAKNPWTGVAPMSCKVQTPHELSYLKDDKGSGSENSCIDIESNNLKNKNSDSQPKLLSKGDCFNRIAEGSDGRASLPECTEWASKELLEFVAHMKDGDTSRLLQFDVRTLLLEYVKKNNLRDPQQKSQIVCDSRLVNLFGKARVGYIEMLQLLESHFLIKDSGPTEINFGAGIINAVASEGDATDNSGKQLMVVDDKGCKEHKKADLLVPQNNPDTYAAIDAHNINLIYLRRSLVENLTEDTEKIHERVVGSFVRIRISSGDQKQDMYRLVQVVGTSKVAEPYKIGARTTDIKLEILNLNRKEVISIDEISNQEFSEDECKRLRQSIKYGLSKKLTVGEILNKALTLQAIRVNDLLEAEILRLKHLRDRASEKGHGKEIKECVEKLQLLSSPEERQRRLREIPDVHSDPNLDSMFESDEDTGESDERKQDGHMKPKYSGFDRRERGGIFSRIWEGVVKDGVCETQDLPPTHESIGNTCITKNYINCNDTAIDDSTNVGVKSETSSVPVDILSSLLSTGMQQPSSDSLNDRSWHYQDPAGKVQGPFSLSQLNKWNASGHFPPDLRIWRTDEKQDNSIFLTDALSGNCSRNVSLPYNSELLSLGTSVTLDSKDNSQDCERNTRNGISTDCRIIEQSKEQKVENTSTQSNGKDESVRSNGWLDQLLSLGTSVTLDNKDNSQDGERNTRSSGISADFQIIGQSREQNVDNNSTQSSGKDESVRSNGWLGQLQLHPPIPVTAFSEKLREIPSDNLREGRGIEGNSEDNGNHASNRTSDGQSNSGQSYHKQSDSEENTGQSSGPNWRCPNINISSDCLVTTSVNVSGTKASPHKPGFDLHISPSPPACTASTTWQAIIGEPTDYDESVSDLLAEVEALESLGGGLESPTSIMKCGVELTDGPKNDCLSFAELSPILDAGKSHALSSTADLHLPPQSTAAEVSLRLADVHHHHHHQRISGVHSSRNAEVEVGRKNVSVSGNQWESGSENSPIPSTATLGLATGPTWRLESENTHVGWGGMDQGNANMGWGVGQKALQENRSSNSYNSVVTTGFGDSQTRHGSDRVAVSRDRGIHGHGRESGFDRGRTAWNREPLFGAGNGGSYRPLPKGRRVCKFHESGYCKKGASCGYLHP